MPSIFSQIELVVKLKSEMESRDAELKSVRSESLESSSKFQSQLSELQKRLDEEISARNLAVQKQSELHANSQKGNLPFLVIQLE